MWGIGGTNNAEGNVGDHVDSKVGSGAGTVGALYMHREGEKEDGFEVALGLSGRSCQDAVCGLWEVGWQGG